MMRRRACVAVALAVAFPLLRAETASARLRRVGVLAPSTRAREEVTLKPFFDRMRELGWVEGSTILYDRAYANDQHQNLERLAAELVARRPDVIYAPPLPAALAAKRATSTVPIVFATGTNPVGIGLVQSLSRPGANVTGIISVVDSLAPKGLELLHEVLPQATRLGLVGDPADPRFVLDQTSLRPAAASLGIEVVLAEASNPAVLEAAIESLLRQRLDAILTNSSLTFNMRHRVVELTRPKRLPVIGHRGEMADAGALFAYGASLTDQIRRSAQVVDKVLDGARPADIPVEQPTGFELVVNLRTARDFGIEVPASVLLRADRVIE